MKSILVVQQFYQARVIDEFVLRGNAALLKCNLPSFVADFVSIEAWIADDGIEILPNTDDFGRQINMNLIVLIFICCYRFFFLKLNLFPYP